MISTPARELAIAHARSYIGNARWRHQGRQPWAIDCVGLIVLSLNAGGLQVADDKAYGREPWNDGLKTRIESRWPAVESPAWGIADVALFKAPGRAACHVGLLAQRDGELTLVHSHAQHNVTEHILCAAWQKLLVGVYSPWVI